MRWQGRRKSTNVEDLRGSGGRGLKVGGGIGGVIVAAILYLVFGGDLGDIGKGIKQSLQQPDTSATARPLSAQEKEIGDFAAVILADTEDVWHTLFRNKGQSYREPKLVLFSGAVESACGYAQSATGPFYCSGDEKVYIDLDFFQELQQRLDAKGDFAMAYVIAHEIGHHVQNLLGIMDERQQMQQRLSERDYNRYQVQIELQADFLAGIWAHHAERMKNIMEKGDLEEAMNAASAVGDDRIQQKTRGYVVPDSFTHGTSKQRLNAFLKGWKSGDPNQDDNL